jgi:hypothetical protein
MNYFTRILTDIKVFFKNAQPIVKGGQLYLKRMALFECYPSILRVAFSGWLLYSLQSLDTFYLQPDMTKNLI